MNPDLETLIRSRRAEVRAWEHYAECLPTKIFDFDPPWRLSWSDTVADPEALRSIEREAMSSGTPRTFGNHGQIPWVARASDLQTRFLDFLADVEGSAWLSFAAALDELYEDRDVWVSKARDDIWTEPGLLEGWHALAAWVGFLIDAAVRCWQQAFVDGAILAVEGRPQGWRLRAPSDWSTSAPIALGLRDGLKDRLAELVSRIMSEVEEAERPPRPVLRGPFREMAEVQRQFDRLTTPPDSPRIASRGTGIAGLITGSDRRLGALSGRHVPVGEHQSDWMFLIAADLAEEAPTQTPLHGGGPRSREAMEVELHIERCFCERMANGESFDGRKTHALALMEAEGFALSGRHGWKAAAERVWQKHAPDQWTRPGRRPH